MGAVLRKSFALAVSTVAGFTAGMALVAARTAHAAPPSGSYELRMATDSSAISVPAGDASVCVFDTGSSTDTICVANTGVASSATGVLTGATAVQFSFPGLFDANLPGTLTGQLGGSARSPVAKLSISASGTGMFHNPDGPVDASVTAVFTCRNPLPHGDQYACKGRLRLCAVIGKLSCTSGPAGAGLHAVNGAWVLDLQLATGDRGSVTGTATTTLPNSASESFAVTGGYAARSDRAKLLLLPTALPSGDKLVLATSSTTEPSFVPTRVRFRLAGVKGADVVFMSPPLP